MTVLNLPTRLVLNPKYPPLPQELGLYRGRLSTEREDSRLIDN